MNPSRATIPLIRPHQCDSEGGRIRGVLLYIQCKYLYLSMMLTMTCMLPKSFRNLLSQNCLTRHGIITRQNNLIPQSRPRTTFSSKLPKHNFTRIWNKTGSTLAHGKNRLTFKRLLKNSYLEAYRSHIKCLSPRCTDCCDNMMFTEPTININTSKNDTLL